MPRLEEYTAPLLDEFTALAKHAGATLAERDLSVAVLTLVSLYRNEIEQHNRSVCRVVADFREESRNLEITNEALRREVYFLRQRVPTVPQALKESPAEFADAFVEVRNGTAA